MSSMPKNPGEGSSLGVSARNLPSRSVSNTGKRTRDEDRRQQKCHQTDYLSSSRGAVNELSDDDEFDDFMMSIGHDKSTSFGNLSSLGKGKRLLHGAGELESSEHPSVAGKSMGSLSEGNVILLSDIENAEEDAEDGLSGSTLKNTSGDRTKTTSTWNADDQDGHSGIEESSIFRTDVQPEPERDGYQATDADDVDDESLEDKRRTRSKRSKSALADITNKGTKNTAKGPKPKKAARGKGQENEAQDE